MWAAASIRVVDAIADFGVAILVLLVDVPSVRHQRRALELRDETVSSTLHVALRQRASRGEDLTHRGDIAVVPSALSLSIFPGQVNLQIHAVDPEPEVFNAVFVDADEVNFAVLEDLGFERQTHVVRDCHPEVDHLDPHQKHRVHYVGNLRIEAVVPLRIQLPHRDGEQDEVTDRGYLHIQLVLLELPVVVVLTADDFVKSVDAAIADEEQQADDEKYEAEDARVDEVEELHLLPAMYILQIQVDDRIAQPADKDEDPGCSHEDLPLLELSHGEKGPVERKFKQLSEEGQELPRDEQSDGNVQDPDGDSEQH